MNNNNLDYKTYKFKVSMTRYYSNSINNLDIRRSLAIYTIMTYITT